MTPSLSRQGIALYSSSTRSRFWHDGAAHTFFGRFFGITKQLVIKLLFRDGGLVRPNASHQGSCAL